MVAQSSESINGYKLTDINLEYETIECPKLAKEMKAEYDFRRELWFEYVTLLKTLEWSKDSMLQVIAINFPRKSMQAVVLLSKNKNSI